MEDSSLHAKQCLPFSCGFPVLIVAHPMLQPLEFWRAFQLAGTKFGAGALGECFGSEATGKHCCSIMLHLYNFRPKPTNMKEETCCLEKRIVFAPEASFMISHDFMMAWDCS